MITGKQIRKLVLLPVNVLVLIDHHVHHAFTPLVELFREALQNVQSHQDQVVKVQCVVLLLFIEIAVVNLHPLVIGFIRQFQQMVFRHLATIHIEAISPFRRQFRKKRNVIQIIRLAAPDKIKDAADFQILEREPEIRIRLSQQRLLVVLVQNHELLRVVEHVDFFTQETHTEPVERRNVAAIVPAENRTDTLFHFVRGLVRERHAKDVRRRNSHFLHEIQIAVRQCPCLAGASPSHNSHIALGRLDRIQLFFIQARTLPFQGFLNDIVFCFLGESHPRLAVW